MVDIPTLNHWYVDFFAFSLYTYCVLKGKEVNVLDQIKIGKFIAECRKKNNLTQMQLAEALGITDRAVSKWENGKAMPDSSIMLDLCKILDISVTDLLCGEVVTMENNNKELEKNMIEIVKQKEESDRRLLTIEWVLGILSIIILFVPIIIAAFLPMEDWQRMIIVFSGFIPAIVGFGFAIKIEKSAGYYECQHCKHRYVPKYVNVFLAPHMSRTRYMKCPKCNQKSWQKKVLSKDK